MTFITSPEIQTIVPVTICVFLRQLRDVLLTEMTLHISSIDNLLPLIAGLRQSMLCGFANIKAAHGVICVGLLHLLRSISEFIETANYLNEGMK